MSDSALVAALERSRDLGFLGPGPVVEHLGHAQAMASLLPHDASPILDLGAGGGVPGLVVAVVRPDAEVILLDAMHKRCQFLEDTCRELRLGARVRVVDGRAEEAARSEMLREAAAAVTARSFGPPAPTAECATGFLRVGGVLVTSEPPETPADRWDGERLADLGFGPAQVLRVADRSFAVLTKDEPAGDRWPRRTGVPARRPLW